MNRFEKQLEKWNNGTLRGAQAKLAKVLRVSTATVALWATGKRHPSKGYLAKMAQLFKLDVYGVSRLFTSSPAYPEIIFSHKTTGLRDADNFNTAYPARSYLPSHTSVSLPVFKRIPSTYPNFTSNDVQDYWLVPKAVAAQAQYIFWLPTPADPYQLLFIAPCDAWEGSPLLLAQYRETYWLVKNTNGKKQVIPGVPHTKVPPINKLKPLGMVVRHLETPG